MLIADDRRRWVIGNAAAGEMLGLEREEMPWRGMDEFTPPAELQRLTRQWGEFLSSGEAEGHYQLYLEGVGERFVEFSATANVQPDRHLLVFMDFEPPEPPKAEPWKPIKAGARRQANLTDREVEVLSLVARGERNAEIAEHFTLSPETVKSHVQNAMSKLGVHTRAHAVAVALVSGQIRWEDD